ncbi:membrane protein insertase YidC [Methanobrevibacter sp.]|uniref:membrane protein insertase YidC n=1 Tax=Methanobrevibacter sp. TaxID=66852 RepID=UPI00388E1A63
MLGLLATQHSGFILGPIAKLLGLIMNAIFDIMNNFFGVQNIGLSIILFTVVVYMFMFPLTYKQQKFSKMNAKISPEIKAIQKKYEGRQDQASMMAMQEETKAVYAKYGVSPSGSCVQLIIQMPILFALYRVIYNVPAYISSVKDAFMPLVNKLFTMDGAIEYMTEVGATVGITTKKYDFAQLDTFVDVLNKFQSANWTDLATKYPELSDLILSTQSEIDQMNTFLGINIAYSPSNLLKTGSIVLMVGAIAIPVLAALTQWLNTKLMPQMDMSDNENNAMGQSMKQMNLMMPLMSAVFCFTLPSGMGLYWIVSAVVRCAQQIVLNKHFDNIDLDALIQANLEKLNEKRAKQGLPPQKLNEKAIKAAQAKPVDEAKLAAKKAATAENIKKATAYYNDNAKPGSLASKANMVKKFEEKNTK